MCFRDGLTGLGKTAVSLEVANQISQKTLVVCPKFLERNWHDEIIKWSNSPESLDVVPYTQLKKMSVFSYDCIIVDEAHYLKNPKAKRTDMFWEILEKSNPEYLVLLSGTPIKNRVPDLWSLLMLTHKGNPYSRFQVFHRLYYKFCRCFCNETTFVVNGRQVVKYDGVKDKQIPYLKEILEPVYFRRRVVQVMKDMPKQVYNRVLIKDKSKEDAKLKAALEMLDRDPKDAVLASIKSANALAKTKTTIEVVNEVIDEGNKVVVFSDHVVAAKELASHFSVSAITGAMPTDERADLVSEFQTGDVKVLVATIGALSVGVNLTAANHMVFNDFPWVHTDMDQAEKRIHRIGQEKTCFYHYILSSELDSKILGMIKSKKSVTDKITE